MSYIIDIFLIFFILVLLASGLGIYAVQQGIRSTLEASKAVTESGFVFLAARAKWSVTR